jgi:hypothetical protein
VKGKLKPTEIIPRLNAQHGEKTLSFACVCNWYIKYDTCKCKFLLVDGHKLYVVKYIGNFFKVITVLLQTKENCIHPNNINVTARYNICLFFSVDPIVIQVLVQTLLDNPLIIEVGHQPI